MKNLNLFYQDIGTSSSTSRHLTQEEAAKEALALRINQRFALLEEIRPLLETMAYNDKFEGKVNQHGLADTGSDINTMPYQIYEKLGREEIKKVEVTTIIAKFLILDIPIDRDAPIVNNPERLFSTFDGICHQTFRAARSDVLKTAESDSDDEEEYEIKRNQFGAPIVWKKAVSFLGSLPVLLQHVDWKPDYKGCYTNEEEAKGQWRTEIRLTDPYGNIYVQVFTTKKTGRKLSKYHKLSDIMSLNWFIE
ncbi:hypothetical protein Tco_1207189 [Tanacetum coccineum]